MKQYKRKTAVTLPVFSFKDRTLAFVRIDDELRQGEHLKGEDAGKQPPWLCTITDLESGNQYEMIAPTLLVTALTEKVGDYVGRCFEIHVSAEPRPGKDYKDVTVYEIECPTEVNGDG